MTTRTITFLFGLPAVIGASCAMSQSDDYLVVYSNAFSKILPATWHITRTAVVCSWWHLNEPQIEIDFQRKRGSDDTPVLGPVNWFDIRIIILKKEYTPTSSEPYAPIPFPLFACTDTHQLYIWGMPANLNWSNSVSQFGYAVRTTFKDAKVANLSDNELKNYDEARKNKPANMEYFKQKWLESITELTKIWD